MAGLVCKPHPCHKNLFRSLGQCLNTLCYTKIGSCEPFGQKRAICNIGYISVPKQSGIAVGNPMPKRRMKFLMYKRIFLLISISNEAPSPIVSLDNLTFLKLTTEMGRSWRTQLSCRASL